MKIAKTYIWLWSLYFFVSQWVIRLRLLRCVNTGHCKKNFPSISYWKSKSLTTKLTTLFCFTTTKIKSLITLTALFYFTTIKTKSLTTSLNCFTSLLLKLTLWHFSLHWFTSLLLKWNLTTLFYLTTVKMKSLTTLTTLFYFTTIKISDYAHYAALLDYD